MIDIPYANERTSNLLKFTAGGCQGSGAGGGAASHSYNYDSAAQKGVLEINIADCGLSDTLYPTPYTTRTDSYYMAVANVTLGVNDNGHDLIFYNALLGAECGEQLDYTVTFDYAQKITTFNQTGCQYGPNGECILPAFEHYNFTITEFTDATYGTAADVNTRQTQANELIYIQIEGVDLPTNKKFAVKKCDFKDPSNSQVYSMFNPGNNECDNDYVDLEWAWSTDAHQLNIQHRLFLLEQGDQDSYQLECELKVCDKDDSSSDCNSWYTCHDDTSSYNTIA